MSSMLVPPESSSVVFVVISSKYVSVTVFYARRVNSGKITISEGYPSLTPSFEGNLLPSGTKFGHRKLETLRTLAYGENSESISLGYGSVPGRVTGTDRRTDYDS